MHSDPPDKIVNAALRRLAAEGLDVAAVLSSHPGTQDGFESVILVGSAGALWPHLDLGEADPVDSHCARALQTHLLSLPFCTRMWPGSDLDVLDLARRAGLWHPSPLGIGVHPTHGPWVAYRGVVGVSVRLAERRLQASSPCLSCEDQPCISACPAGAVSPSGTDIHACFTERLTDRVCATSCAARRACPVGRHASHSPAQEAHHHTAAINTWRRWERL